ncbi:submandibular gland secretory Glx-rich protein CA-like [Ptychodera flava]|uniref:submandibular gland secretory Glx-rich protein CA-like n=1 Tax=Ptychodera flava TaxID=63121 RepID=UPI00396A32F5
MKGKGKAEKYEVTKVDVATSPVHQRRQSSRASMVSSDGSTIQEIESQFQKKALLKKQSELDENDQIKTPTQELLIDDEFASEVLSELNLDQVDLTEGNLAELVAQRLIESGLVASDELVHGQNPTDGQPESQGQGDANDIVTDGDRTDDKGNELVVNEVAPDVDKGSARENQPSETNDVPREEDKNTSIAQATGQEGQPTSLQGQSEQKTDGIKGNVNEGENNSKQNESPSPQDGSKDETASVGKRSIKSSKSKSGKKKKGDKKVTFVEEAEVKRATPRSPKSPKGKKGKSAAGKKGGKAGKGDKKGKKKGGKKSPTPSSEPSETESQPEQNQEKPPDAGDAAAVEQENKDDVATPEEPKEPEKIILDEPPQYCLASEYKSKEQMVREWLHGCSTNAAIRTHPII